MASYNLIVDIAKCGQISKIKSCVCIYIYTGIYIIRYHITSDHYVCVCVYIFQSHTQERIVWVPTRPASMDVGESYDIKNPPAAGGKQDKKKKLPEGWEGRWRCNFC